MKRLFTGTFMLMSAFSHAQNESTTKKDQDVSLSAMYIINTSGKTMSGGCVALSVNNFSVLAMMEHGNTNSYYYGDNKLTVYNVALGHKIAQAGNFRTTAFIGGGALRTTSTTPGYYTTYSGYVAGNTSDDFRINMCTGLLGEGRYMSFLAAVESNYISTGLLLGIGINSGIFK